MRLKKENLPVIAFLVVSVFLFFSFGFFHLAKFETTDEHLWKFDRTKQYWQALANKDWEKTYINDKPGVTVALVSGIGLFFEPNPENNNKITTPELTSGGLFDLYKVSQTERINMIFRLPILIFSALSLIAFFWLSLRAFSSTRVATITTVLIATNPILVGISQVINPDSFFWIFGGLSALAYLAFLNTQKKKFLVICGLLTGFALLSKYTAFMLFLFYALAAFSKIIFQSSEKALRTDWKTLWKYFLEITIIFLISIATFSILLPAVFIHPEYLFKGISQFLSFKNFLLFSFAAILAFVITAIKKNAVGWAVRTISDQKKYLLAAICLLFSLILIVSFVNVWTGQKLARVDALRDAAYANEPKEFNFKPLIEKKANPLTKNAELFLMEAYPFVFSLSPIILLIIFFVSIKSFSKRISDKNAAVIFPILTFALLYFSSTIFAGIVTNVRYSIILYPLFAILGAIGITEFIKFKLFKKIKSETVILSLFLIFGVVTMWTLKPFYFSYTNVFLPGEFSIHDSWGHGSYEAAQYLNALPNAKDLIIWSNSDTVCRFFEGKCMRSRKIDLGMVTPDYFVISKRGELKLANRFILNNNPDPKKDSNYYFSRLKDAFVWQLLIDNREDNYVKILKFEK